MDRVGLEITGFGTGCLCFNLSIDRVGLEITGFGTGCNFFCLFNSRFLNVDGQKPCEKSAWVEASLEHLTSPISNLL